MKFQAPRGTKDIFGKEAKKLEKLISCARQLFYLYNYQEIILPTFEDAQLFIRSIGENTDIVEKEMYVFSDRKGRKLALRPEGTAGVIRAYLENNLFQQLPVAKLYYWGTMFRYERPQAGRYREFFQIGAEYIGNSTALADAEIIFLARDILLEIGIDSLNISINSLGCNKCRPQYQRALIDYLEKIQTKLCPDCQRRLVKNPLRVLDCKNDSQQLINLPRTVDFLCAECRKNFEELTEILQQNKCSFTLNHRLVRGLDYYTGMVFEITANLTGSQDAISAGGRYDNLVEDLGGKPTPAVGFALGAERVLLALKEKEISSRTAPLFYIAYTTKKFSAESLSLATKIRAQRYPVEIGRSDKNLADQLRLANKLGVKIAIILAEEEYSRGQLIWREMDTGQQEIIPLNTLIEKIKGVTKITNP